MESDNDIDIANGEVIEWQEERKSTLSPLAVDLTTDDGWMNVDGSWGTEDRKPFQDVGKSWAVPINTMPSRLEGSNVVNQNVHSQLPDDCLSDFLSSAFNAIPESPIINDIFEPNVVSSIVVTNAISSSLHHEVEVCLSNNQTSMVQNQSSVLGNTLAQQSQPVDATVVNEQRRWQQIPSYVSRNPMEVEALHVPSPIAIPQQRSRSNGNIPITNSPSTVSQAAQAMMSTANTVHTINDPVRREQFSRSFLSPITQSWQYQICARVASKPPMHQPFLLQSHNLLLGAGVHTLGTQGSQQSRFNISSQQKIRQALAVPDRDAPYETGTSNTIHTLRGNWVQGSEQRMSAREMVQASSVIDSSVDLTGEQNWRPTGRMRGSLSERSYAAYKDLIIEPTQSAQVPGPPPGFTLL